MILPGVTGGAMRAVMISMDGLVITSFFVGVDSTILPLLGSTSDHESHRMATLSLKKPRSQNIPSLATGSLPVQTVVTAILPRGFQQDPPPVTAGQFSLNGNGEMAGTHWIHDGGWPITPRRNGC